MESDALPQQYRVIQAGNPAFRRDHIFRRYENTCCDLYVRLRERYCLEDVIRGVDDELARILLLRHWLRGHVVVDFSKPTVGTEDLLAMLDAAPAGGGYHCSHFMVAQDAVMNALGYVSRRIAVGPGGNANTYEASGHHGVNEIWSNSLCKWFVSDAEDDCHFEKDGVPLSALEIRDEVLRNGASEVQVVQGPGRVRVEPHLLFSPHAYEWIAWDLLGERRPGELLSEALVVYEDDHFRRNTWNRWTDAPGGVMPHYAYEAACFVPIRRREWIEWTPNVLHVEARARCAELQVRISSCTPNLRGYELFVGGGIWQNVPAECALPLGADGGEYVLRSVNMAGVTGPEHQVRVEPIDEPR